MAPRAREMRIAGTVPRPPKGLARTAGKALHAAAVASMGALVRLPPAAQACFSDRASLLAKR